jgi:uncharacterized protein (TIGR02001 family)
MAAHIIGASPFVGASNLCGIRIHKGQCVIKTLIKLMKKSGTYPAQGYFAINHNQESSMKKVLLATAVVAAFAAPASVWAQAAAAAPASPHTVTGNMSFNSEYRFRGISQTFGQPALQGGIDYSHSSGLYLGTWASNVYGGSSRQPLGTAFNQGNMEWDFYGGYKFEPIKDVTFDLGVLTYQYPGAKYNVATNDKYTNTEIYGGLAYKWFTAKYSSSITDYFGVNNNTVGAGNTAGTGGCGIQSGTPMALTTTCAGVGRGGSKGSSYLDLGATFDIGGGFNLGLHYGKLSVKNYSLFNYSDYKVSLSKDWVGFTWSAAYIDSNAKADVYRTAKINGGGADTIYDTSKGTLVLSVAKTF